MRIPSRWQFRIQIDRCTHPSIDASQPWFPQWVGRLISGGLNFHPGNLFISVPSAISRPIKNGDEIEPPPIILPKCQSDPTKGVRKTSTIPQLSVILRFHPVLSTLRIRKVPQHMQFLQDLQSLLLLIAEDEVLPTCQGKWDQTILVFFRSVRSRKKRSATMLISTSPKTSQNTCFWETYPMLTIIFPAEFSHPVTIPVDETWSSSFGEAIPYPNRKNHVPSGNLTFCNWTYPIYSWFTYSEWWFSYSYASLPEGNIQWMMV